METSGFEFYRQRIKPGVGILTATRFVHWASVAMLREEIGIDDFYDEINPFSEHIATIAMPNNRLPASRFVISSLGVFWGSSSTPAGLYLPHIENAQDQDAYRLNQNGHPSYQIYSDRW